MILDLIVPGSSKQRNANLLFSPLEERVGQWSHGREGDYDTVTGRLLTEFTALEIVQDTVYFSLIVSIAIHRGVSSKVVRHKKSDGHPNRHVLLDAKVSRLLPKTPFCHAGRCSCLLVTSDSNPVPFSRTSTVMCSRILDAVHFQSP